MDALKAAEHRSVQVAAVTPLLRAAMATHDAEKLATALAQAEVRLGPALVEMSAEYQLAQKIVAELAAAAGADPAAQVRKPPSWPRSWASF
jgi:hypothetical protein